MNTNMRSVIRMKSMNDLPMTLITKVMDCRPRRSLVTRKTRKVLKTLIVRKAYRLPAPPPPPKADIAISTMDRVTTPPSSRFMTSLEYFFGPKASSLRDISTMKIHVKTKFMSSRSFRVFASISYESIAIPIVLMSTQVVKNALKMLNLQKSLITARTFFTRL